MEQKEYEFKGIRINGIAMLIILCTILEGIGLCIITNVAPPIVAIITSIVSVLLAIGFVKIEPNEARVMMFFGNYCGTYTKSGFHWVNPFINTKKISLRARNLDAEPIKVNDQQGNPIMIGLVLVWKVKDTYKALFEIDVQTMAATQLISKINNGNNQVNYENRSAAIMNALENFVRIQADAALRQVAGQYAYDSDNKEVLTLRDGSEEINKELKSKIDERLVMAGIQVVEARINYLAYAPEIAAIMLRRQQATAVLAAREKIVEGAVSMVKMALDKMDQEDIIDLDNEKRATMVSNLLVVLCSDNNTQPVINTGTLYQ